jgi:hypothetical protein
MEVKTVTTKKQNLFITGGFIYVLGMYVLISGQDFQSAFVLIGFGIVLMASTSKERMKQVFDLFFSIFKQLLRLGSDDQ